MRKRTHPKVGIPLIQSTLTRRRAIGYAASTAGLAAAGGLVFPGTATAAPASGHGVVNLVFQSNWQGSSWNGTAMKLCQEYVDGTFNVDRRYKGIRATVSANSGQGGASAMIASILVGAQGLPDIVEDCCNDIVTYEGAGMLQPLNSYVTSANLNLDKLFINGHVQALSLSGNVYALPSYDAPPTLYYRQDVLDDLGLPYPDPTWTFDDAVKLWTACTSLTQKTPRSGVALQSGTNMEWCYRAFGGSEMNAAHTYCELAGTPDLNAANWQFRLLLDQVANQNPDANVLYGENPQAVFSMCGGWNLLPAVENLSVKGIKWNILPMPIGPVGHSVTFDNVDFYGILRTTKHPEEAWQLCEWLTCQPAYTKFMMRVNLTGPALLSMWEEWQTIVRQAVPLTRQLDLQYCAAAAESGHAYPNLYFLHGDPQAEAILVDWQTKIMNKQVDITEGYVQAAKQINAWLAEAPAASSTQSTDDVQVGRALAQANTSATAETLAPPSPATSYTGTAPATTAKGAITVRRGGYTMVGEGSGIQGTSDGCTFLGLPWRLSRGSFSCRIASISALGQPLPPGAKMGLMARSDLGASAAAAAFEVAIARGVHFNFRQIPGMTQGEVDDQQPAPGNGLPSAAQILIPGAPSTGNYLLRPIWLKLVREVANWTGYTSFDGNSWIPGGEPVLIATEGAWIGLFATPHMTPGRVQVVFDHVSFTPTSTYQIGGSVG